MKTAVILVRVAQELADQLKTERVRTGVPTSEFIRRAIRLALFGDDEAIRRMSVYRVMTPEQRKDHPVVLFPDAKQERKA